MGVPVVDPIDPTHTNVIGYGEFLLLANGPGTSNFYASTTNGNDPYCAIYVGTYVIGSPDPGTGGTSESPDQTSFHTLCQVTASRITMRSALSKPL